MLQDIFQVYRNRLVDLSSNNRSIFLPRLIQQQMIDLKDFHFLNNHPAFYYITELLGRKRSIPLIQVNDARDKNVNQLSQRLKGLHRQVKFAEEESGEKSLFVGWPFVEGKLVNDQLVRCPLIFFPVALTLEENVWFLRKNVGEQAFINPSFLLAYGQAQGKPLDRDWMEQPLEEFSKDPIAFRTDLYHYLTKELVLDFNREIYQDKLEFFLEENRSYFEEILQTGMLKLQPYAVLGQFSQKSSFLMDDYSQLIQTERFQSLDDLFGERFGRNEAPSSVIREDNLYNTLPLDASQEEVLSQVKQGASCIVQGPPGTGKSQLICNLVADFISRGKKVLVVSQKRVALDVVYERLAREGFGNFAALVHDFRGDRKELYRKIAHQIGSLESYRELNRTIDAIQLERSFNQQARLIDKYKEFFEEYREALYESGECGVPIKELYLNSSPDVKTIELGSYFRNLRFGQLDDFLRNFESFYAAYKIYDHHASFWFHRVNFADFKATGLTGIKEALEEISKIKISSERELEALLGTDFEFNLVYESFEYRDKLAELEKLVDSAQLFEKLKELMAFPKGSFDLLWLENKSDTLRKLFEGNGIEWHTKDEDVEHILKKAIQLSELLDSWLGKIRIRTGSKKYWDILNLLELNQLGRNKEGVLRLMEKLENRLNLNHQYTLLGQKEWMKLPKKPFSWQDMEANLAILRKAVSARFIMADLGVISSYIFRNQVNYSYFLEIVQKLIRLNNLGLDHVPKWRGYFTDVQLKHLFWSQHEDKLAAVQADLARHFEALRRHDVLKGQLQTEERLLMEKLIDSFPDYSFEQLKGVFLDSLKLEWIEHIEAKYPVLKEINSPQIKRIIDELQVAVEEKDKIARFIIELRLREEVCRDLEYNRLNNLVTYRDLSHQVSKKKFIWPIKRLVEQYDQEVFKLMPCWLASPETASALFPLEPYFDLVVFDEASQCYFERALPVMLRGRQVVIAGDSQQLQPVDLYKVRLEADDELPELELDSLLEMGSRYFPSLWLKTHYRSDFLPLIDFSNKHFYDNKLSMLPDMHSLNRSVRAFQWVKCEGIWEKQVNRTEAEEVVEQVKKLLESHPRDSIGVITFNYFQMMLVMELLEGEKITRESGKIKVRNIENVQGDEFDRVVFSVGYAPNIQGKFSANFGLLVKRGGENRLNVAITRARKEIILISSIESTDFKEQALENKGVRLLRDYIHFVQKMSRGAEIENPPEHSREFRDSWSLKSRLIGNYGNHVVRENAYHKIMDMEVLESGELTASILTDDQRFYAASSAKESLVFHPRLLRAKNWNTVYLFSRQYWMDREDLLQTRLGFGDR